MKIFFALSVLFTSLSFASDVEEKKTTTTEEVAVETTQAEIEAQN